MDEDLIFIEAEESGERIDALLARNIGSLSRNAAQRLIEQGFVLLFGQSVKKNYRCAAGDVFEVQIPPPEDASVSPEDIPLDIRFEDESVIVVNKPRGMVVHPAPGHSSGTLVNALLFHCGDTLSGIGGEKRPGIVHRIDKDTSGLLIVAKTDAAHQFLSAQLSDRSLSREYEAIACGRLREESGSVDRPIGRCPVDRKKMAVTDKNSRSAVTHWNIIARYKGYSHIRCRLETGRTHQIRVHLASIGHPLLGDGLYGAKSPDKGLEGQCLHAKTLKFIHPDTHKQVTINTELPDYFKEVLERLGPETD